jgi:hypothetical protein
MLESYIVTLPDGSQGTLGAFYEGIMDESIQATDAGYVLSDGTLLPTNGEAMWNPDADVLITLMSPYLSNDGGSVRDSATDDVITEDDSEIVSLEQPTNLWKVVGVALIGYILVEKGYIKI